MTHTLTTATKTDAVGFSTVPPLRMGSRAPGVDLPESSPAAPAARRNVSPVAVSPVRVTGGELILRCYVTYHSCLPPALAYWAVLGQFGWSIYTKRGGKTVTVGRVYGTDAWARDLTVSRLRLLGMRWTAMSGKDSTRTDGKSGNPRRTDLDQPDPGGSRDSATDR